MEGILNLSTILTIVGILVVLTNIVVQVLKKATWEKLPTNILAIIVSVVLTRFSPIVRSKQSRWSGIWSSPLSSWGSWLRMQRCSDSTS